jgi:hypothetical protein
MALLIMVTLRTVSSFFSTCGCFLRGGRSPSGDLPLSLDCGWPPGANGSPPANGGASRVLGLKILRVQGKGGRTNAGTRLGRPAQAQFGPVRPPLRSRGSSGDYALSPSTCMILTMSSSRPRWRFSGHEVRSFTLQSPGLFLHSTSVLATIGSDFIKLMNTNKTP